MGGKGSRKPPAWQLGVVLKPEQHPEVGEGWWEEMSQMDPRRRLMDSQVSWHVPELWLFLSYRRATGRL